MFIKAIVRIDQIHDQTHKSLQSSKWCEEDEEKGGRVFSLSKMIIMVVIGQWWWVSWSFEDQTGGGRRLIWGSVSKIIASKWCCGDPHQDHEYHSHHLIWKQGLLPKGIQHWFADQHYDHDQHMSLARWWKWKGSNGVGVLGHKLGIRPNGVSPIGVIKISIPKVKIAVLTNLPILGENSSHKASVCLRARGWKFQLETLFGRIPFEQHLCYTGSSLTLHWLFTDFWWLSSL